MSIVTLNEYMSFVNQMEDVESQPPFQDEMIEAAEYFSAFFSKMHQAYCLKLVDSSGDEIARSYWKDPEFMQEYMLNFYNIEISDEDLDDEFDMKSLEDAESDQTL